MTKNKMAEVAALFGKKLGERFCIDGTLRCDCGGDSMREYTVIV